MVISKLDLHDVSTGRVVNMLYALSVRQVCSLSNCCLATCPALTRVHLYHHATINGSTTHHALQILYLACLQDIVSTTSLLSWEDSEAAVSGTN